MNSMLDINKYINPNHNYFIYGLSNLGKWLYSQSYSEWGDNSPIRGFIETNPSSSKYANISIFSPDQLDNSDSKLRVIIASYTHASVMCERLLAQGIPNNHIFIYEELHAFFRSLWEKEEYGIDSICFWPPIGQNEESEMILSKIHWFISSNTKVVVFSDEHLDYPNIEYLIVCNTEEYIREFQKCSKIFLWDNHGFDDIKKYQDKVYSVDTDFYYTTEIGNYQFLQFFGLNEEEKELQKKQSKHHFSEMKKAADSYNVANIVCNGPSINEIYQSDQTDLRFGFNILVNTTIKDKKLVELTQPKCLIITDTIYLSPYKYLKSFYDALLEYWRKYKFWIVAFEHQKTILDVHFPELSDYIIGVPFSYGNDFVFPSPDNFFVNATYNVLTEMAIPIASSMCNEVGIYGCTGRKEVTNSGWGHSTQSDYDETKNNINKMWRSLFRDYPWENDYEMHCRMLTSIIEYGESIGKRYNSKTTSYIPALTNLK